MKYLRKMLLYYVTSGIESIDVHIIIAITMKRTTNSISCCVAIVTYCLMVKETIPTYNIILIDNTYSCLYNDLSGTILKAFSVMKWYNRSFTLTKQPINLC